MRRYRPCLILEPVRDLFLFSAAKATFDAISKTYSYLTPDLWKETIFTKSPYQVSVIHGIAGG